MGWTTPAWVGKPTKFELFLREKISAALKEKETLTYMMKGSKGNEYKVAYANDAWTCECLGYTYRKKCTHIDRAKAQHQKATS